ncbi:fumarylacetoacetate hydrolase family protein [Oceanobacillus saliphilus]|uniref:fumarylacetoacetate hydrolase family protein n=1 Tax=Oceanobacillus saliphilus TaxID=2925834 RepID=UPI00201DB6B4|nr:fumarylacetoacetate hydrolase family protein [Oceanobacillus saliphilus]
MKLVTFSVHHSKMEQFGIVIDNYVFSFEKLQLLSDYFTPLLKNVSSYLQGLPESEQHARKLYTYAQNNFSEMNKEVYYNLEEIKLYPPIPNPPAVFDFGLSPKHLLHSGYTLIEHELKGIIRPIMRKVLSRALRKTTRDSSMPYYKCNHLSISGPSDTLVWPSYTSYLDVEPELGIVIGHSETTQLNDEKKTFIAGYVILNDVSARDVQLPDFRTLCGPARSKDFDKSIGIGPYLVTPDEIDHPLSLDVSVQIGESKRLSWKGSTSDYVADPQEAVDYLSAIFTPPAGTIIGMGTIPGCCGLDNNQWLIPGDAVKISIQGLGTLKQFVPSELTSLETSRWRARKELKAYYK